MKCYYHNDLDGRCAGAIVYRQTRVMPDGCSLDYPEMIEVDYKDEIDISKILPNEEIVIVDFSFKPEIMEKVLKITKEIIWIDHHKTAFEYKYSQELKGLRDNAFSGCELAWKYFYPTTSMRRVVELIGDRDKWAWKFGKDTAWLNLGLHLYPHKPQDGIWEILLFGDGSEHNLKSIMAEGKTCEQFRNNFCKDYANSYGFEAEFEGHKCFALGLYMFGSEAFGERFGQYDICLSYEFLGDKWTVGLYSKTVDVSVIAKKYGGGGHKGASGFICKELPFKILTPPTIRSEEMKIENEGKWILFELVKEGEKTNIWQVITKQKPTEVLGIIKWFPRWRKYAFFPTQDTVYENTCLQDIADFIEGQMRLRPPNHKE